MKVLIEKNKKILNRSLLILHNHERKFVILLLLLRTQRFLEYIDTSLIQTEVT